MHGTGRSIALGIAAAGALIIMSCLLVATHWTNTPWKVTPAGRIEEDAGPPDVVGKIVIRGPSTCQYGEFDNRAAVSFALVASPCKDALDRLEPAASQAKSGSRIRAIGEYFRRGQ